MLFGQLSIVILLIFWDPKISQHDMFIHDEYGQPQRPHGNVHIPTCGGRHLRRLNHDMSAHHEYD